jgi:ribosomal protein L4
MQLEVLNLNGTSTGRSVNLPEAIFGVEPNEHVLYLAVKESQDLHGRSKDKRVQVVLVQDR